MSLKAVASNFRLNSGSNFSNLSHAGHQVQCLQEGSKLSIAALLVSPSGALRRALWAAHSRTSLNGDFGLTSDSYAVKAPVDFLQEFPARPSTAKEKTF